MLLERLNENENREFMLIDDPKKTSELLSPIIIYLQNLLIYLWNDPKLVSKILINSNNSDVKKYLAPFFVHNFYENILSSNYIENNLFYLIALLLKNEINNDKTNEKNFLDNTPCAYILEELKYKNDTLIFFNLIIKNVIEKIENSSTKELNFDTLKIKESFFLKKKKANSKLPENLMKSESRQLDICSNKSMVSAKSMDLETSIKDYESAILTNEDIIIDYNLKNTKNKNSKIFITKYTPNITKEVLNEKKNEYKNDSYMTAYINYLLNEEKNNDDNFIFSNNNLMQDIMNSGKISKIVLTEYSNSFLLTVEVIDIIFENLLSNIDLIPYSIKYICKMIFQLVENKYKNKKEEENLQIIKCVYLAKFIFNMLFLPIFKNANYLSIISNTIISETAINNIKIISEILSKLISFKFFKNIKKAEFYTPFNYYFLDKIPQLFKFMNEISNIELPNFIENCIDDSLSEDYIYNYFDENQNEVIFHRSICYSTDDIYILINNINRCKDIIFDNKNISFKKTFEKISVDNSDFINNLENLKEYVTENNNNSLKKHKEIILIKYFLMSDFIVNDKYTNLFKLTKDNYNIKNSEDNLELQIKNCLCILLYNLCILNPNDFKNSISIIDILKHLKNLNEFSTYIIDKNFHAQWYIDSLLLYIKQIPENLIQNNFNKLYNELINEISDSISNIKFEIMSMYHDKLRIIQKNLNNFDLIKEKIIDIDLNKKVQSIIENANIFTKIYFKFNDNEKEFSIIRMSSKELKSQFLDDIIIQEQQKNTIICKNIKTFALNFPDLVKYQKTNDINSFEIIRKLKIDKKLIGYFRIIIEYITKTEDKKESSIIYSKIYDYVMEKLYSKIFPIEPSKSDVKIFQNSVKLSWIELKHLVSDENNYVYERFLPEIFIYINKIFDEKSPRKKFLCLNELCKIFLDINSFNGGDELDLDHQIAVLTFVIIKAQPVRIFSNYEYIDLFLRYEIEGKKEESRFAQLLSACKLIYNFKYENIYKISEEEYMINCTKSLNQ